MTTSASNRHLFDVVPGDVLHDRFDLETESDLRWAKSRTAIAAVAVWRMCDTVASSEEARSCTAAEASLSCYRRTGAAATSR